MQVEGRGCLRTGRSAVSITVTIMATITTTLITTIAVIVNTTEKYYETQPTRLQAHAAPYSDLNK